MKKTVNIPVQARLASLSTVDKEARTVRLVWSTGAAVKRMDFWTGDTWIEELSMDPAHVRMVRLNSGAPLLNAHGRSDLTQVIGVTEKAWIEGKEGIAEARFSRRADVTPIWGDVEDGIIRNVSVGYQVNRFEDVSTKEDIKARVRRMRAVDWEPMEISLVPVGADAGAGVRSDATTHPCEIEYSERAASAPESDSEAAQPLADSLTAVRGRSEFLYKHTV